ncbi:MAG: NUDIX domain-containing protein [Oscillospiraceae bacterium]|nr:NUDIX domain-containing protein [Oscillospiraceae bacterium]
MPKEKSCGAVLYTVIAGTRHYVLVINDNGGNCTIPKGHVEGNETEKETALREIFEETNIHAEFVDGFRKQITILSGTKEVVFFIAKYYENQSPKCNPNEHDEIMVLPFEEALAAITWEHTKEVLCEAERFLAAL